jgi:hypothetical protein
MKRLTAFLLVIISVFLLCSCGQSEKEEFLLDFDDMDTEKIDYDGYTFNVWSNNLDGDNEALFSYVPGTLASDLLLQRIRDIEKEFNCKLNIQTDGTGRLTNVEPILLSGSYVGDVMFMSSPAKKIRAGLLYPLDGLQNYLDYNDSIKYGGYGFLEEGLYNSVPYTVAPVRWPGKQGQTSFGVFAINENLIMRYGLNDPRDYLENGVWNWEMFEKCLPEFRIDDGTVQTKSVNITWSLIDLCLMNGVNYYEIQPDGTVEPALDSEQLKEALDFCSRVFTQYADCVSFLGHDAMLGPFKNNEIVMTQTAVNHIIRFLSYDMDNYGIVPMPCGPHGTYGEWVNAHSENDCFGIFYNTNDPEASARIIDRFCDPFDGYETDEALMSFMSSIFFDDRDVALLMELNKHVRWQYWPIGAIDSFFSNATSLTQHGKPASEIIEKYSGAAVQSIIKHVIPNVEFIENYKNSHDE